MPSKGTTTESLLRHVQNERNGQVQIRIDLYRGLLNSAYMKQINPEKLTSWAGVNRDIKPPMRQRGAAKNFVR